MKYIKKIIQKERKVGGKKNGIKIESESQCSFTKKLP